MVFNRNLEYLQLAHKSIEDQVLSELFGFLLKIGNYLN